ncbi:MAG: hypothetical protein ABIO79_05850 [Ferruginibacter sp.]
MKHAFIFLICGFIFKFTLSQCTQPKLFFGNYEGVELRYFKLSTDTSDFVDRLNKTWGTKKLTLDSNGTFTMKFPIPWPSTIIGDRLTKGNWVKKNDTLILNSYYLYKDFMKVKERITNRNHIQVKLKYEGVKRYYPSLSLSVNDQTKMTNDKPWTYFPLDTVKIIEIDSDYKVNNHKWRYKTINKKSNYFIISLCQNIEDNNFVLEDYKLLIIGLSLIQIDKEFELVDNRFEAKNFR